MTTDPAAPASPVPDDKDWTWVLERPCPECGFDASQVDASDIGGLVRDAGQRWQQVLAGDDVRRRPTPTTWSAAEYGSHCRDVCEIFHARLKLMLQQDDPLFANWDQDQTALEKRYWADDPAVVAVELVAAAERAATVLRRRDRRAMDPNRSAEQWFDLHRRDSRPVLRA